MSPPLVHIPPTATCRFSSLYPPPATTTHRILIHPSKGQTQQIWHPISGKMENQIPNMQASSTQQRVHVIRLGNTISPAGNSTRALQGVIFFKLVLWTCVLKPKLIPITFQGILYIAILNDHLFMRVHSIIYHLQNEIHNNKAKPAQCNQNICTCAFQGSSNNL